MDFQFFSGHPVFAWQRYSSSSLSRYSCESVNMQEGWLTIRLLTFHFCEQDADRKSYCKCWCVTWKSGTCTSRCLNVIRYSITSGNQPLLSVFTNFFSTYRSELRIFIDVRLNGHVIDSNGSTRRDCRTRQNFLNLCKV